MQHQTCDPNPKHFEREPATNVNEDIVIISSLHQRDLGLHCVGKQPDKSHANALTINLDGC